MSDNITAFGWEDKSDYYIKNREKILLQKAREYRLKNKEALSEKRKLKYLENKETLRIKNKEWRDKNRERINEQQREKYRLKKLNLSDDEKKKLREEKKNYQREYRKRMNKVPEFVDLEKERWQKYYKNNRFRIALKNLKNRYGITRGDYLNMLESQGGVCAICKKENLLLNSSMGNSSGLRLYVDHCHSTNKVRGLLCGFCNHGLGSFKDDVEIMNRAVQYLLEHR